MHELRPELVRVVRARDRKAHPDTSDLVLEDLRLADPQRLRRGGGYGQWFAGHWFDSLWFYSLWFYSRAGR